MKTYFIIYEKINNLQQLKNIIIKQSFNVDIAIMTTQALRDGNEFMSRGLIFAERLSSVENENKIK